MPTNLLDIISLVLLVLFFGFFFLRILLLKIRGIQAVVLAKTHISEYFLMPIMFLLVYVAFASALPLLPFPKTLLKPIFEIAIVSWIGILLSAVGVVGLVLSFVAFGSSFRMGIDTENPDKLVTTGIFSISRNPMYTAIILFFIGLVLAHPNISFIVVFFGIYLPFLHYGVLREEKFLKAHYGEEYREYAKKVRRYL